MIFYGDAIRLVDPRARLNSILHRLPGLGRAADRLSAHTARVRLFLELAELSTAVADVADGACTASDTERQLRAALLILARAVDRSWRDDALVPFEAEAFRVALPPVEALPAQPLAFKRPEGYAYYALYPELYAEAARDAALPRETCVIGLRSIGTGLAAMVAAACGSGDVFTVRPHGPPFAREVTLSDEVQRTARRSRAVAIVDEGPGLSGSSFLGTLDALESIGVAHERVHLFPSHDNGPGGAAAPEARIRWQSVTRHVAPFERGFLDKTGRGRLADWVTDITGPLVDVPRDLSGGTWRDLFGWRNPPACFPMQERRKYLFAGSNGRFLAKFVGLGGHGDEQVDLQAKLAQAGFVAPVAGMRHGFLVTPWIDGQPLDDFNLAADRRRFLDHLTFYLAYRARACPAEGRPSAALPALATMARTNLERATGRDASDLPLPSASDLRSLARELEPVRIDGRLHAWEWLRRPDGSFVKCDAVDHHAGHDLVGCQDIAWDIAGTSVEFALDKGEIDDMRRDIGARGKRPISPEAVATMQLFYAAFQLGLWTFARDAAPTPADAEACERRLAIYRGAVVG